MARILNIDTALETASLCLADHTQILAYAENADQKDHASWIHEAIHQLMNDAGSSLAGLEAIAVSAGPGSYTGLRVGLSTAKGLCYALNIPLIMVGTLDIMANAARSQIGAERYCPMIDARRNEVYTAVYDPFLAPVIQPAAWILDEHTFDPILGDKKAVFFGNGSPKFKGLLTRPRPKFVFEEVVFTTRDMTNLSLEKFKKGDFADLAYSEPLYIKEFHFRRQ